MITTPKLKISGLAVISLLGMALTTGPAFAVPVSGSSASSFNGGTCNFAATCTVGGPGNTNFTYGDALLGFSSITAAGNPAIAGATDFTSPIGSMSWTNKIDPVAILGNQFGVNLAIAITLTLPPGGGGVGGPLVIVETLGNLGFDPDTMALPNIAGNLITIQHGAGTLTISNFQYSGTGLNGLVWTNPENNTRVLTVSADFKNVPEPATLALVGSGLMGLGYAMRRRRKAMR
jgi:PEP-CTERM motif